MRIKNIFVESGRLIFYNQKFMLLLWGANLLLAFVLSVSVFSLLGVNIGHSLMSDTLAKELDYVWLIQFYNNFKIELGQIPLLLYGVAGIYILLNTFTAGGFITVFAMPQKNHWVDFFYGGIRYWMRFVKVFFITAFFYILLFLAYYYSGKISSALFADYPSYLPAFAFRVGRYLVLLFFIGVITIVSDYTRVAIAMKNGNNVIAEMKKTIVFIRKNFNVLFTVFFLTALLGALGVIVYNLVGLAVPRSPFYFLTLTFLLQQILIIFRINIRMFFFATEVLLCKELNAEVLEEVKIEENQPTS